MRYRHWDRDKETEVDIPCTPNEAFGRRRDLVQKLPPGEASVRNGGDLEWTHETFRQPQTDWREDQN